jgi:hypothetical protein
VKVKIMDKNSADVRVTAVRARQAPKIIKMNIQLNLELRTQYVPGDGSTFKLFDFRVKFPHKK